MTGYQEQLVRLEVSSDGDRGGARAFAAAEDLYHDLRRYMPKALVEPEGDGDKGDPITLLSLAVVLVSSGAITELIKCVRDWLNREPSRRRLRVRGSDGRTIVSVDADNVDDATVAQAITAAAGMMKA